MVLESGCGSKSQTWTFQLPYRQDDFMRSRRLRPTSHYGRRSRGCQSPPIKLQETNNLVSRPFTLEAKVQRPPLLKMSTWQFLFYEGDGLSKEVWVRHDWKPKLWLRGYRIFFIQKLKKTDKILVVRLEGLFWVENQVGCSSFVWTLSLAFGGFTLWPSKSRGHESSWPHVWTLGLAIEGYTLCPAEGSNT
jgi:hypothetical protein